MMFNVTQNFTIVKFTIIISLLIEFMFRLLKTIHIPALSLFIFAGSQGKNSIATDCYFSSD